MKNLKNLSLITVILISSILSVYRISNVDKNEISWDVLGYYLYLPATFIHHDPTLKDISWLKKENDDRKLAGTLYMITQNDKGETMYFFLMGMALFYLPFFFMAGAFASVTGMPVDGFSAPYQYLLVIGGIIYTIIGLFYLRKILKHYFSETISSLVMLIIVFGTNYINHLTIKNLETVNVLFMLVTIVIWNTIKWHDTFKGKYLLAIGIAMALMVLVKPSEAFIVLLPLLWNVTSWETFKMKLKPLWENRAVILLIIGTCLIIALPQLLYWHSKTGKFIFDSYKNPGIGLDLTSPHIINALFSFRKGWLLYTPLMIFPLIGFYFLYKNNKSIFYAAIVYFLVSFYIIASWTEWWYGAGFSLRPVIATYPILAICLGYFLNYIQSKTLSYKIAFGAIALFFIFLNQFQWWQYKNYILDPYRTTRAYYTATFLKTKVTDADRELLRVYRDFSGGMVFKDRDKYQESLLLTMDFSDSNIKGNMTEDGNNFYKMKEDQEFLPIFENPINEITQKDHIWIKASMDIRFPKEFDGLPPCMVLSMDRKEGPYGYSATEIKADTAINQWRKIEVMYLTPEIRSGKDRVKCYIWKRGKSQFDIDNIKLEVYKKK
jgi:hypothetical protein